MDLDLCLAVAVDCAKKAGQVTIQSGFQSMHNFSSIDGSNSVLFLFLHAKTLLGVDTMGKLHLLVCFSDHLEQFS